MYSSQFEQNDEKSRDNHRLDSNRNLLANLDSQILDHRNLMYLAGEMKLTKTERGYTEAYLCRDFTLESQVEEWIRSYGGRAGLLDRYRNYDPQAREVAWPRHYPVRILAATGGIASGENIFMFFPLALGVAPSKTSEVFGFEFIDAWRNIFLHSVFPCAKQVFDTESYVEGFLNLELHLDRTLYLASVLHEIGHLVGPWKCVPSIQPRGSTSAFQIDVLCELGTDCLMSGLLPDIKELALFVVLARLFWFGRRGFRRNSSSGLINSDGDAWTGSFLWNALRSRGLITPSQNGKYKLHFNELASAFSNIIQELGEIPTMAKKDRLDEGELLSKWMEKNVDYREGTGFVISEELRTIYDQCHAIVEVPVFAPLLTMPQVQQYFAESCDPRHIEKKLAALLT